MGQQAAERPQRAGAVVLEGDGVHEGTVVVVRLDHEQGEQDVGHGHAHRDQARPAPALQHQEPAEGGGDQGQIRSGEHGDHSTGAEEPPPSGEAEQGHAQQGGEGQDGGVEPRRVHVVDGRVEGEGAEQDERGPDPEVRHPAGDAPQWHHAEGQQAGLDHQQGRDGGQERGQPGDRVEAEPGLFGQQVGPADGQERRIPAGDEPGPLDVGPEVGSFLEAAGPGQGETGQQGEQADEEGPGQHPIRALAVQATLEPQREQVEASLERELPPLAHPSVSSGGSSSSIGSVRCSPWLRTLLTSVLTGWSVISEEGAGTRSLPSRARCPARRGRATGPRRQGAASPASGRGSRPSSRWARR